MGSRNYGLEVDIPIKLLGMFVVHVLICLDVLIYFPSGLLVRLDRISGTMVHGDNYQSYSMPVLGVPWQ